MNDRRCFEALDRCLKDILDNSGTLFGGKSIMLGGDFRQTLPVKKKASKSKIVDASITASYLWPSFQTYVLQQNMRLTHPEMNEHKRRQVKSFSEWLLNVGDGKVGTHEETDNEDTTTVHIPNELCIMDSDTALTELINFIYDEETLQRPTARRLQKRVIVCPKNETADAINAKVLTSLNRSSRIYFSSDEATPHGDDGGETELLYPTEYLNSLTFAGLPPHRLELKVGAPIILLRNLNLTNGLCNGTRMIVTQLLSKVIEAQIITGTRISEKVFLPRIPLINRDLQMPFVFKRKQFPVKLSYAMTINKSQGQSLEKIGVFLPEPVFAHGQLYVALTMANIKTPTTAASDKGKMTVHMPEVISLKDIKPTHTNKTIEARVYRKWTAMNVTTWEPTNFCCILLDKEGNAIQANMNVKDTNYFNQLLQLNNAYRISHFVCTETKNWQRTLDNKTTLLFGQYTKFQPIPADPFPEHYFKFVAYNEVKERADVSGTPLIDYIGCIHQISDPMRTGDATRSRRTRRIIQIQNLEGVNLPFVIWNEQAEGFDIEAYTYMPKPVVIAVSSTWATRKYGGLQLKATPATHYYLNPNIPEANYILNVYAEFINPTDALEIQRQPFSDDSQEQMRNRYSIASLLNVNPQHYMGIRFTTEATVLEIIAPNGWYYRKCALCNMKVATDSSKANCPDHGPQPIPNYGYCFRAVIDDGTATTMLTCFSPEAHTFVPECNKVVAAVDEQEIQEIPATLKEAENKTYIFQYRFGQKASPGNPAIVLTTAFQPSP
ncbi:DNA helicase [Tanacetum coccineum]|uniref:ATP-dependent DNA helicase n=1 Tax=Tanacetum coccineum TaxID=301880 RepID=A0ABQ4X1N2_9ASTR